MAKLIAVQLETCHANPDSTAWYAYFDSAPTEVHGFQAAIRKAAKKDGAPLGVEFDNVEEVPNELSKYAKLRRIYIGYAV